MIRFWTLRRTTPLGILSLQSLMMSALWKAPVFMLVLCGFRVPLSAPSQADELHSQINRLYRESVQECAIYYAGDPDCIKAQFQRNYRWAIMGDQKGPVGHPGIPGLMSGDATLTAASDRTQSARLTR